MQCEQVRESLPSKTKRAVELATEKGASNWLTVIPIKEMNFNLSKREFRDAIKLRYDWEIADLPAMRICGDLFTVDHAMVCRHGGLIIQRHNEIRDLIRSGNVAHGLHRLRDRASPSGDHWGRAK